MHALKGHGLGDTTDNDGEFTFCADGFGVLGQGHGVAGAMTVVLGLRKNCGEAGASVPASLRSLQSPLERG